MEKALYLQSTDLQKDANMFVKIKFTSFFFYIVQGDPPQCHPQMC